MGILSQQLQKLGFIVGFISCMALQLTQTRNKTSDQLQNNYTKNEYNTDDNRLHDYNTNDNRFYQTFNPITYYENNSNIATNKIGIGIGKNNINSKNNEKNTNKNVQKDKKSKFLNEKANGPLSSKWAPRLIYKCSQDAPINSAPCLQNFFGDEIILEAYDIFYEGFKIREPIFSDEKHRQTWLSMKSPPRFKFENNSNDGIIWAHFKNFTGSNFVLRDGSWTGRPQIQWGEFTCLDGYENPENVIKMIQSLLKYYISDQQQQQYNQLILDNFDGQQQQNQQKIYAEIKKPQQNLTQQVQKLNAQIEFKQNQDFQQKNQKENSRQLLEESILDEQQKMQIYQILKQTHLNSTKLQNQNQLLKILPQYETVLFVATADHWSFQHFLDRSTHVFIQSEEIFKKYSGSVIINGLRRKMQSRVLDLWKILGVDEKQQIYLSDVKNNKGVKAKNYIDACRTILVHPYMSLRMREMFQVDTKIPLSEKKVVLFMSRQTKGVINGGRRVLNLQKLLHAINETLQERNQGEKLMVFREGNYSTHELIQWMSTHVRAMIGPHGGALYNHRFMGSDSILYELSPSTRSSPMFWEEASLLGQKYIFTHCKTIGEKNDMVAPINTVIKMLDQHLGKPPQNKPLQPVDYT